MLKKILNKLFKPSSESTKTNSNKLNKVEDFEKSVNQVNASRNRHRGNRKPRSERYERPGRNREQPNNESGEVREFVEPSYPPNSSDRSERRPRNQGNRRPRSGSGSGSGNGNRREPAVPGRYDHEERDQSYQGRGRSQNRSQSQSANGERGERSQHNNPDENRDRSSQPRESRASKYANGRRGERGERSQHNNRDENKDRSSQPREPRASKYANGERGERSQHNNPDENRDRSSQPREPRASKYANGERGERSQHNNRDENRDRSSQPRESRASKYAQRRRSKDDSDSDSNNTAPERTTKPRERSKVDSPTNLTPPPSSPPQTQTKPSVSTQSVFNSDKLFKDMGLTEALSSILAEKGFVHPSNAQAETLPIILEEKNLICSSETGSGKTLAFSIPILEQIITKKIDQACILTPTREIAIQIESVIKPIAHELDITTGLAIGGLNMSVQKNILRAYPQILIATPGRLVDVLTQGLVWLNYTQVVVLDEVDRMLDMGFEKEITTLFENFPSSAQILMFTATMNKQLEKLSRKYVKDYELVKIGETMKTKNSIEHLFLSISPREKYDILKKTLLRKKNEKVLIFCNSINDTSSISRKLKKDRLPKVECLHSKKSQTERNHVLDGFRSQRINHLLTTDVLARGIDIPNIEAVINYELPYDPEDYVHRIGRTGRADLTGKALSFVDAKSELKLKKIKQLVKSDSGFNFIGREALETF